MRYFGQVKPISFLKAHAARVLQRLHQKREALVIAKGRATAKAIAPRTWPCFLGGTQETLSPCSSSRPLVSARCPRATSGPRPPC